MDNDISIDDRLDNIFNEIDRMFLDGDFERVENTLKYHLVSGSSIDVLIAYATITLSAKDNLVERKNFMSRVREEITKREPERVDALLQGLE
jgi:hypothetical protein